MYAIIRTGGKQYRVEEGNSLVVEKLKEAEIGQEVSAEIGRASCRERV